MDKHYAIFLIERRSVYKDKDLDAAMNYFQSAIDDPKYGQA